MGSRRDQYSFSGSQVQFSTWGFWSGDCSGETALQDRGVGTFAIGPRVRATVPGYGFEVAAWELDATWSTGASARSAVGLGDVGGPLPYLLFARWDSAAPWGLEVARYDRDGLPPFDMAAALDGSWVVCLGVREAAVREFDLTGIATYWEGAGPLVEGAPCPPRRVDDWEGLLTEWAGSFEVSPPITAHLDGTLVTAHVVKHWLNVDHIVRWETVFIHGAADPAALYFSSPFSDPNQPERTLTAASGAWVRF